MTNSYEADAVATIVETAQYAAEPTVVSADDFDALRIALLPQGGRVEVIDLEQYADRVRERPRRITAARTFVDADSFTGYLARHAVSPDIPNPIADRSNRCTLWADVANGKITAILDDHEAGLAGRREHTATYTARRTAEWQAWRALHGKQLTQEQLAEFLEDHLVEVVEPDAALLVEVARTFEATKTAEFRSANRLANGTRQLIWSETVEARAGQRGEIQVPETVTIGVPVYEGHDGTLLTARLRYRVNDGQLRIVLVFERVEQVERDLFRQVAEDVERTTGVTVYWGAP